MELMEEIRKAIKRSSLAELTRKLINAYGEPSGYVPEEA
jgi:hypothetical protein